MDSVGGREEERKKRERAMELVPLPRGYYYFFAGVEPILTLAGAIYSTFFPTIYHYNLVPSSTYSFPSVHNVNIPSIMSIRQLGNC